MQAEQCNSIDTAGCIELSFADLLERNEYSEIGCQVGTFIFNCITSFLVLVFVNLLERSKKALQFCIKFNIQFLSIKGYTTFFNLPSWSRSHEDLENDYL